MYYIVYDLEFNQDLPAVQEDTVVSLNQNESTPPLTPKRMPFEIIQIGAVKLNQDFQTIDTFSRLVKPTLYTIVSPFITELTGITTDQVKDEACFPEVYQDFLEFVGKEGAILCVWGKSDVKELYRNVSWHELDQSLLPKKYLNIQPYASQHLGISPKKLLRLKHTVEALEIPLSYGFHDAGNDAYYTAEILKKIYQPTMKIKEYEHEQTVTRPKLPKMIIDFDMLIRQFEKMYGREMTEEEQGIIKLAYQMGKTHQFLKEL